jgi:hypothetical protein
MPSDQYQQPSQQSQLPPPQPGQQQSGYPAGPPQPGQAGYRPPSEPRAAAAPDPQLEAERREAQAASSIGAQVILDFNEDASLGARGGAGADIVENQMARDTHLAAMGLDPVSPSGPPPTPEALRARREAEAKAASEPQFMPPASGKATRVSSLAAGINSDDVPLPPTEPPAEAQNQPAQPPAA